MISGMAQILLIAPGVDHTDIGEAWVGYQWASRLSERHSVTLLTYRKRGRPSAIPQLPKARVIEWRELPLIGRAERFNSLFKPGYFHYYRLSRRWIRAAIASGECFDFAHQPVPVAMRYPSPLAGLGIPFVVGPVGGSMDSPPGFGGQDTAPWYTELRRIDRWRLKRDPFLRRSYADASVVLGIAPYVAESLAGVGVSDFRVMSETGVDELPVRIADKSDHSTVKLLFVGRLIRTKGARDIIQAMAGVDDLPVTLDVVGDGFDRRACEELALEVGVSERVHFHGSCSRLDVEEFYREADVFVFPSYREPGGNVPFEAMSHGLPMIVSDRGGPGYVVADDCGIKLTPTDPVQLAADLSMAIRKLATNADLRTKMGEAARRRVIEIGTWDQRMVQIDQVYDEIAGRSA